MIRNGEAGDSPESGGEISESALWRPGLDRILYILSNRYRRLILLFVKAGVVKTEADVMMRGVDETEEGEIELVHNHLPKLEDAGYIEWDRETGAISKGPRFDEIETLLELIEHHADELPADWP